MAEDGEDAFILIDTKEDCAGYTGGEVAVALHKAASAVPADTKTADVGLVSSANCETAISGSNKVILKPVVAKRRKRTVVAWHDRSSVVRPGDLVMDQDSTPHCRFVFFPHLSYGCFFLITAGFAVVYIPPSIPYYGRLLRLILPFGATPESLRIDVCGPKNFCCR